MIRQNFFPRQMWFQNVDICCSLIRNNVNILVKQLFAILSVEFIFLYCRSEDSDDELSDSEIDKIVIVTQQRKRSDSVVSSTSTSPPSIHRPAKHEGYDRTGHWTTRTKMTQELAQVINDGLRYFEEDSLTETESHHNPITKSSSFTTVNVISKEDFEKLAPQLPRAINPEFPPPPPVPCNTPLNPSYLQDSNFNQSDTSGGNKHRSKPKTKRRSARFYPVDETSESKEQHVGWIRDGKSKRTRTTSMK